MRDAPPPRLGPRCALCSTRAETRDDTVGWLRVPLALYAETEHWACADCTVAVVAEAIRRRKMGREI